MQPYLYTVVEKEKLHEMLEAFYACLKLPIQVIDNTGNILESCGQASNSSATCPRGIPVRKYM